YRRAPPAHHHGEGAGGDFLRRAGLEEKDGQGGRGLRAQAACRHREGSGSEPVYFVRVNGATAGGLTAGTPIQGYPKVFLPLSDAAKIARRIQMNEMMYRLRE